MILVLIFVSTVSGCSSSGGTAPISRTGFAFDTVITITVYSEEDAALLDGCFALADHYEKLLSKTLPESDVSRINTSHGEPVSVDLETREVLRTAIYYADLSDGAFDPTIGALSSLWNFHPEHPVLPSDEEIQKALRTVDYQSITIDDTAGTVALGNPESALDLGGIAKGYIADRLKEYLLEHGVQSGLINLGGNVLTLGKKPDGQSYRIGVQKPFAAEGEAITTLSVSNQSLVSSGVYERYFEQDGTLYHHILDTKTGYPVQNNLLGVTILSEKSVDGDALSTICLCLGLKDGMELIESLPGVEAVFITKDMALHPSSRFPI